MYIRSLGKNYDKEECEMGNNKMTNRFIRYVLMLLLCGLCHTVAVAGTYDQSAQSKSWGYQPVYNSTASTPAYQFYTTSSFMGSIEAAKANSMTLKKITPRRNDGWGDMDDDDNPIGEVDDDTPIGDTPWLMLLLLAAAYFLVKNLPVSAKNSNFAAESWYEKVFMYKRKIELLLQEWQDQPIFVVFGKVR